MDPGRPTGGRKEGLRSRLADSFSKQTSIIVAIPKDNLPVTHYRTRGSGWRRAELEVGGGIGAAGGSP
jgi:hypothetical protein